jgi:hypothetical protein
LKGRKSSCKTKGAGWVSWLSGVGTTRGACWKALDVGLVRAKAAASRLAARFSDRRVSCGGGTLTSTTSASPSKTRVMAIWKQRQSWRRTGLRVWCGVYLSIPLTALQQGQSCVKVLVGHGRDLLQSQLLLLRELRDVCCRCRHVMVHEQCRREAMWTLWSPDEHQGCPCHAWHSPVHDSPTKAASRHPSRGLSSLSNHPTAGPLYLAIGPLSTNSAINPSCPAQLRIATLRFCFVVVVEHRYFPGPTTTGLHSHPPLLVHTRSYWSGTLLLPCIQHTDSCSP